jgi:tetratricopeptide (TPR) repeat protein
LNEDHDYSDQLAAIEQMMDEGRPDEAGARLEEIDVAYRSARYGTLLARSWRDRGDPDNALAVSKEYLGQFPGYPALLEQNRGALIDRGELSRLQNAAAALKDRNASQQRILFVEEQCAYLENDIDRAIELLRKSMELETDRASRQFPSRLYDYLYLQGENTAIVECLDWYLSNSPTGELDIWPVLECLSDLNEADFGERQLLALRDKYPTNSSLFLIHVVLLRTTGRTQEIANLLDQSRQFCAGENEKILSVWLEGTGLLESGENRGIPATALAHARFEKDFIDFVSQHGLETTRTQIERLQDADKRAIMREQLESIPRDTDLKRPLIAGFCKERNWCAAVGEDAAGTAVIFTGVAGEAGNVPVQLFDRYLAALNMDAVYLRDPTRHCYGHGVPGLCQSLHDIPGAVENLSVNPNFYGISFSAGSFGLVGYFTRTNLRGIMVFQGFTDMHRQSARYRGSVKYMDQQFPQNTTDWLQADGIEQLDVPCHFVCGTRDPECFPHMMRMTRLPNIHTTQIEGANHHSLCPALITSGRMLPLLSRAFATAV